MGYTENCSATFLNSGNPCVDLFFHVVPNTPASYFNTQLPLAWAHNDLTTFKLICNLRGVRGTGKSNKEGFYTAAFWLHKHHPKTLACNVASLAEFGYFKDLPEILYRLLEGEDVRKTQKAEWLMRKSGAGKSSRMAALNPMSVRHGGVAKPPYRRGSKGARESSNWLTVEQSKGARVKRALERTQSEKEKRVSDLFAECLKSDIENFKVNQYKRINLAAKCPIFDSSFDKDTLLCESIGKKVFPRELYPEYEGVEEVHYAYRVRDRPRKDVLVPLRKLLELPEVYIGDNQWGAIPYNRVASVAMKFYREKFLKHDQKRFMKYLEDVKAGKSTIAADGRQVAELQWKRMVDDLLKQGKMKNCLAVCDVSGSMNGTPMEVSVALGLLVSELSDEPWKWKVITFSQNPQLHFTHGSDLRSKLKPEQMIRRIFVFSDMEFDQASSKGGYGNAVPQIVFRNLRHSMSTPVTITHPGVALLSGFSKNLMKLFLDNEFARTLSWKQPSLGKNIRSWLCWIDQLI
ncbi:hypothetical protein D8674_019542 [Pyrus ussuriensis x Pyrus communis]|uniref:Uncharacterized protein n=1 Tax=Pyrus ussuriensis x Pyrus communis TaxID=2448454 RepID=A0A5N5GDE9_9ROSA|nr:hypothetical protein D8674_019542 [Pyrus ussuriensis x Pyrus communis]